MQSGGRKRGSGDRGSIAEDLSALKARAGASPALRAAASIYRLVHLYGEDAVQLAWEHHRSIVTLQLVRDFDLTRGEAAKAVEEGLAILRAAHLHSGLA